MNRCGYVAIKLHIQNAVSDLYLACEWDLLASDVFGKHYLYTFSPLTFIDDILWSTIWSVFENFPCVRS